MPTLLIVHHTVSPPTQDLLDAVKAGATNPDISGVDVVLRPALSASAADVLEADGYLLGTPANLGYISGALKHFFDQIYYPCLDATVRRPYAAYVHGNNETTGALRAIEEITTGLQWHAVLAPLSIVGKPGRGDIDAAWELGAAFAALLAEGMA
jgi:NAD(P)H-dependent FMN reductase